MLNYICPDCGTTVSAADGECPRCAATGRSAADETAELSLPAPTAPRQEQGNGGAEPPQAEVAAAATQVDPDPAATRPAPVRSRSGLQVRPWHYGLFAFGVVAAILGAVALSGGFGALRLEDPAEEDLSRVEAFGIGVRGPIEVSGIRPYYDDEYQAHVRAFVANHSSEEQSVAVVALMRVREASEQAPPLATFEIVISDPMPANGGVQVDVPLRTMGTLQSLPPWNEIRVDLEVLGARSVGQGP